MDATLSTFGPLSSSIYYLIRNSAAQIWQTTSSTLVTFVSANYANYPNAFVETPTGSGFYVATFPNVPVGYYSVVTVVQSGGSPSLSADSQLTTGAVYWDGTSLWNAIDPALGVFDGPNSDVETGFTFRQVMRIISSVLAGQSTNGGTTFRDLNNTTNRVTATVDTQGDRTAITTNVE
jgi:hypothetical protein